MTEQTKKLNKTQLKRWKLALKEAANINRKLKRNKGSILIDTEYNTIVSVPFSIGTRGVIGFGDNAPEYDNGFMYNTLDEIRRVFKDYRVFKELK